MITITPERLDILEVLNINGEMRVSEIQKALGRDVARTTISNILPKMLVGFCIVNSRFGYYRISKMGELILSKCRGIELLSDNTRVEVF